MTEIQLYLRFGRCLYFVIDWVTFLREYFRAKKVTLVWLPSTKFPACKCLTSVYLFCCRHNQHEFSDEICS